MSASISRSPYVLYLSKEGDSVEIRKICKQNATASEKKEILEDMQKEAVKHKTHETVLIFLKQLSSSDIRNHLNFYHDDNPYYTGHVGNELVAIAHPCALEKQIDFVQYKISEQKHGVRAKPQEKAEPQGSCVIQ